MLKASDATRDTYVVVATLRAIGGRVIYSFMRFFQFHTIIDCLGMRKYVCFSSQKQIINCNCGNTYWKARGH